MKPICFVREKVIQAIHIYNYKQYNILNDNVQHLIAVSKKELTSLTCML